MTVKNERVKYCDFLRFIAIMSVILIHVFGDFRNDYLTTNRLYYFLITCFDSFTRVAVPIFFMLTGVFMLKKSKVEESYMIFLKKRISKLLIPFFVISFLYYLVDCFFLKNEISFLFFFRLFTSNQIRYHFWFMYSIILIYLLIPFLKKMISVLSQKDLRNLCFAIFFMGNGLALIYVISNHFGFSLFQAFIFPDIVRFINYLFIGYYLHYYGISKKYHKLLYILSILSVILMPIGDYFISTTVRNDEFLAASSFLPVIAAVGVFTFFKEKYQYFKIPRCVDSFITRMIPFIFYIYMIHVLIMENVCRLLKPYFTFSHFGNLCLFMFIEFVITFIISYILAYILNYLYSKVEKKLLPAISTTGLFSFFKKN